MISLIGKMGIRAYRAPELSAPEIIEGGGRRVHIDEEGGDPRSRDRLSRRRKNARGLMLPTSVETS